MSIIGWLILNYDFHICGPTSVFHFHPHPYPIGSMVLLYMVTFTINIPPMLAYIPYMDSMGMSTFTREIYPHLRNTAAPSRWGAQGGAASRLQRCSSQWSRRSRPRGFLSGFLGKIPGKLIWNTYGKHQLDTPIGFIYVNMGNTYEKLWKHGTHIGHRIYISYGFIRNLNIKEMGFDQLKMDKWRYRPTRMAIKWGIFCVNLWLTS